MVGVLEYSIIALGGIVFFTYFSSSRRTRSSVGEHVKLPPVYGPWYLPYPIRGLLAMIELGMNEDDFLLSARRKYGAAVFFPWPLNQIYILEGPLIQKIYATPSSTLSFIPVRRGMQTTAFGSPHEISQGPGLGRMFPVHAKGLTNLKLDAPVERFARVVQTKVAHLKEQIDASPEHTIEIKLVKWVVDTMFEAATSGLFGDEFCERAVKADLQKQFNDFDASFPLVASEIFPMSLYSLVPPIAKGVRARKRVWDLMAQWVEDGLPGLEEGVIRDMAEMSMDEGYTSREIASLLFSDLWALQANAPYMAAALLLYVVQNDLLPKIRAEIDGLPRQNEDTQTPSVTMKTLSSMPLVGSCVQETIRTNTSSFSIRVVEKEFVLSTSSDGTTGEGILIPAGVRVICATRVAHLCDDLWGANPDTWVGTRFMAQSDDDSLSARRSREMNGFGGGISICEGRHLATAELKTILSLLLADLDITPLYHIADPKIPASTPTPSAQSKTGLGLWQGLQPSRDPTRPGLGAFQFGTSDVMVRMTKRKF